jgi:DNA-directed RNA polymerase specialized sigma24 family protein
MQEKRQRVRLPQRVRPWTPSWEPEIKGWAYNHIAKNKWRLEYINDFEDLLQDAYLVFLKVCDTYPRVVEPAHFMALYKTSLRNFLHDKSREYTRKRDLIDEEFNEEVVGDTKPDIALGTTHNDGPFLAMIGAASPELKMLLSFIEDDNNLARLREPQRQQRGQPRMTLNQRLSSLLGIEYFPFKETLKQLVK